MCALILQEILKWTPPKDLVKDYPYYLSGFDEDNSPSKSFDSHSRLFIGFNWVEICKHMKILLSVWVAEMGKWDTRKSAEGGPERERDFKKYIIQFLKRCEESVKIKSTAENPVTDFSIIVDMDGYSARQTASAKGKLRLQ